MKLADFVRAVELRKGRFHVEAILGTVTVPLLEFSLDQESDGSSLQLPRFQEHPESSDPVLRAFVANALVRAGAPHPGLEDGDLARLHREAREHGHVELFVDINALSQGLVTQLVRSLGTRLARVVASSSTIDVLHEYQSVARQHHDGNPKIVVGWELARGMRLFRELRIPVYVHQLAPGAARYFRRQRADGKGDPNSPSEEHREEVTYISEDRQMIAGFWHYVASAGPRIPLFLVTADLALAHVCAAERVPFVFARAPRESAAPLRPEALWFDPYAMKFRTCVAQAVLWEMAVVFGRVNVRPSGDPDGRPSFGLRYDPRTHMPGTHDDVVVTDVFQPDPSPKKGPAPKTPKAATPASERVLKLSLRSIIDVLPTNPGQRLPQADFKPKDEDSIRQVWQIGEATGLFQRSGDEVVAGGNLAALLAALKAGDYLKVNGIFRAVPGYDKVLREAEESGVFPPSNAAGAATGWAVVLGAAYKLPGNTRFGLAPVTDEQFDRAVVRAHAELGADASAVPMHRILDRVCTEMRLSPVRFEVLLSRGLGTRGLAAFEAQRARSEAAIPAHEVMSLPTASSPRSYLRKLAPGSGVLIGGKLVGSLVRRSGRI